MYKNRNYLIGIKILTILYLSKSSILYLSYKNLNYLIPIKIVYLIPIKILTIFYIQVYKKKLNKFEIALNIAKRLKV